MVLLTAASPPGCQVAPRGHGGDTAKQATSRTFTPATNDADTGDHEAAPVHVPGEGWRLPQDVYRAARELEWGVLRYEANPPQPRYAPKTWRGVVSMDALTPDGREAHVSAEAGEGGRIAARVRIGLFGDEGDQARFVQTLRTMLARDPQPVRGWGFTLPEPADDETSHP